jgi:hypothetical protein
MEVPELRSSSISSLDDHVSVVDQVKVSLIWKSRNNVEIFLNNKSELLVELSLSWFLLVLINIHNLPSLVNFAILVFNDNVSVFIIEPSLNGNDLSFIILDDSIIVSEDLPPS